MWQGLAKKYNYNLTFDEGYVCDAKKRWYHIYPSHLTGIWQETIYTYHVYRKTKLVMEKKKKEKKRKDLWLPWGIKMGNGRSPLNHSLSWLLWQHFSFFLILSSRFEFWHLENDAHCARWFGIFASQVLMLPSLMHRGRCYEYHVYVQYEW